MFKMIIEVKNRILRLIRKLRQLKKTETHTHTHTCYNS